MRLIPGKTKVQIELFKGVTLADFFVSAIAIVVLVFIIISTLPYKFYIIIAHVSITAALLLRLDAEPNYMYLLAILRHYALPRRFERIYDDKYLINLNKEETKSDALDELFREEPEEEALRSKSKKERLKEKEEEDRILNSETASEEEKKAILEKRKKEYDYQRKMINLEKDAKLHRKPMPEMVAFTGISDNYIEYGGLYYGAAIEIPPIEFRFFSQHRRRMSIENGLGRILRNINANYSANIVKIERPIQYEAYLEKEYGKLFQLREAFEKGLITEDELKVRVEVLYDRINELQEMCDKDKIIAPFYYIVLFENDKQQLEIQMNSAMDLLRTGEMDPKRLNTKELAVFLKYSNTLDFEEKEIDELKPEQYAEWAMPQVVDITPRTVRINRIITHNFRMVNYPAIVGDSWIAGVMSMPGTKCVIKCKPMDRGKAIRGIDRSLQELRGQYMNTSVDSKQLELQTHIETLGELLVLLNQDNESLLEVNVYVTAYDIALTRANSNLIQPPPSSLSWIDHMKKNVRRVYQESNFRLNNMEFDQFNAFVGAQVSGYDPLAKKGRGIPSNSVAAAFPWIYAHVSDEGGIHLGNSDGIPVFIDFFRRDNERINSNMVIMGKSGSGKSYATKSLLTNLAADDSKIFILDPENEYTELAENLHGKFINVGNAQYGRLNPFHIITSLDDDESDSSTVSGSYATHLQFLEEFFRQILPDCDKDAMEYLNSLIDRMYTNHGITAETNLAKLSPEDYPIFDDLYDAILLEFQQTDNQYVRSILRILMNYIAKFSTGGRNANIWNGPSTITTEENFTVFNFQSLLANRNGTIANAQMLLVLKYIDNEIIKNRDYNTKYNLHRKIVVVIDEAHVFIDTKFPVALDFMFQLAKRIRKYNGMQIVITQNIKDFVGSEEIARKSTAIINACQYSFIFALAPNDMQDLCKLYEKAGGINETEQEQITTAPRGQAFTVMSANSRSTFQVDVPEDVVDMFSNQGFVSRYFTGEEGMQNWEDFIGDSRAIREANLFMEEEERARAAEVEHEIKHEKETRKRVVFFEEELSDIQPEMPLQQSEALEVSEGIMEPEDITEAEGIEEPETLTEPEALSEPEDIEEPEAITEPEDIEEPEAITEPEDIEEPEAVTEPERVAEPQWMMKKKNSKDSESTNTEKLLASLLEKFSYAAMMQEIRRTVQSELKEEMQSVRTMQEELVEQKAKAELLEQQKRLEEERQRLERIAAEEAAKKAMEEAKAAEAEQAEQEEEEEPFDIMALLALQAEVMENMSDIEKLDEWDDGVVDVTIEELIAFRKKKYNTSY